MRALILAGGFATRLRPLSCSKPKLLFPIVGVPLVESMTSWLSSGGVDRIILAVNHLSDKLKVSIGDRLDALRVYFSVEQTPLGTAGPISLAASLLNNNEPFVVLNGDIVTDIDLKGMLAFHNKSGLDATIALVRASDSSPYGSVSTEPDGLVREFIEKSGYQSGSNLVNAGVYIFSPRILESIPKGRPVSLERDIFPGLAETRRMQAWMHKGSWYDIGRLSEYIKANKELLGVSPGVTHGGSKTVERGLVIEPSFVGTNVRLEQGATIGPSTILSQDVRIREKSIVKDSIIFEETDVGEGTMVEDSIVGERVVIGKGSKIGRGSIVAGQLTLPAGTHLAPNSTVLC